MRSKNPVVMEKIKSFVEGYYRRHQTSPSIRTIAGGTGISKATVQRYLVEMDDRGMVAYSPKEAEIATGVTRKCATGYFSAPLVGSIRCGDPESEEEQVEEYVNLPESIFGKGHCYLLRAQGDSMTDAGIEEGDLLVIHMQQEAHIGDIVVALDQDRQNTLKRYGGRSKESGKFRLEYMNEARYPGRVIEVPEFTVQGVVRNIIKSL